MSETINKIISNIPFPIDKKNMFNYIEKAMQQVEKIKGIPGSNKYRLLIEILEIAIKKTSLSEDDQKELTTLINFVLPNFVDVIIKATKGELNINEKIKRCCF